MFKHKLMKMIMELRRGAFTILITVIFFLSADIEIYAQITQPSQAQSELFKKRISLNVKRQTLAQIIADIADQAKANILIDDTPVLEAADVEIQGTLKEALDKISEQFDYTWTLSKHGAVLMRKQFKTYEEYPQLNVPELRQTAREVLDVLNNFSFDPDSSHYPTNINVLFHSFTPEQVHILQTDQPLYGYQLAPAQFDLMRQIVMSHLFVDTQIGWQRFAQQLDTQFNAPAETSLLLRPLASTYRSLGNGKPTSPSLKYNSFEYVYYDKKQMIKHRTLALIPVNKDK